MKTVRIYISIFIILLTAGQLEAQSLLGVGVKLEPDFCFTAMSPSMEGTNSTNTPVEDGFNFRIGLNVDYEFDMGLTLGSGVDFSRKQFSFHHVSSGDPVIDLRAHGEYYTVEVPLNIGFIVFEDTDPYFELSPYIGITGGLNILSYRNLTRMDNNPDYSYTFNPGTAGELSFVSTLSAGIQLRTIIDQLGPMTWQLFVASDITRLPIFSYDIVAGGTPTSYTQQYRLFYVGFGTTLFFRSWDLINGRLNRRY